MREKGPVKMEAGMAIMQPQAKACPEPQKLEEARTDSLPDPSKGAWPCCTLIRPLESRTVRESIFVVLSHKIWGNLLQEP